MSLTVTPVNDAPVAQDLAFATAEDTARWPGRSSRPTSTARADVPVVAGPGARDADAESARRSATRRRSTSTARDSFTYVANDGALDSNVATVSLTVTPVNDAPVAHDAGTRPRPRTLPVAGTLVAADVDSPTLTFRVVTGPTHGSVTVVGATFTYVPALNFNGVDCFTYIANDGSLDSNVATVSLTVTPVNDAPVARDLSFTSAEDTAAAGSLAATDVDSPALTFRIVAGPAHGTLDARRRRRSRYAPTLDFNGVDSLHLCRRTTARSTRTSRRSRSR